MSAHASHSQAFSTSTVPILKIYPARGSVELSVIVVGPVHTPNSSSVAVAGLKPHLFVLTCVVNVKTRRCFYKITFPAINSELK